MKKNEIIKDRLEEWVESKGFLNSRFTSKLPKLAY